MPRVRTRAKQENKENESSVANEQQTSDVQVQDESEQLTDKMQKISLTDDNRKGVKFATKKKTNEPTTQTERKRKKSVKIKKVQHNDDASDDEVIAKVHVYDVDDAPACNIYDVASDYQSQEERPRSVAPIKRVDVVQQPVAVTESPVKQAWALFDWGEEKIKETLDTKKLRSQELNEILKERNLSTEGTRQQKIQRLEDYLVNHEGYQPSPKKETSKLNIQIKFDDDEPTELVGFGFRSTNTITEVNTERKPVVKTYSRKAKLEPKPEAKPEPVKQPAAKTTQRKKK